MKAKTKGIKQEENGLLKKSKDAAENVKDNLTRIEEVADKAKKFAESPEMKWFMGFKV